MGILASVYREIDNKLFCKYGSKIMVALLGMLGEPDEFRWQMSSVRFDDTTSTRAVSLGESQMWCLG